MAELGCHGFIVVARTLAVRIVARFSLSKSCPPHKKVAQKNTGVNDIFHHSTYSKQKISIHYR